MSASETIKSRCLTPDELRSYYQSGFVVVNDLIEPELLSALGKRIREYTHEGRPAELRRGELKVDHPGDGIRKIGGLVENDDLFRALAFHENMVGIVEQIVGPDIKVFRNHLLLKPPRVGSAKGMHQDSPYWPIEPMSLCCCWFALDDATIENGCMGVIPGVHRFGPLPHKMTTDDYVIEDDAYDPSKAVMAPVRRGGALFLHSLAPHGTAPNNSDKWRRALALTYLSARSIYVGQGESPRYVTVKGKTFEGCVQ